MILTTPMEGFYNDLCDVARLFFGDAVGQRDGREIRHEADGWRDVFSLAEDGREVARHASVAREARGSALLVERMRKRACKSALYALLKRHTGRALPWGSLTGIRPTRLYAEALGRLGDAGAAARELVDIFDVTQEKALLLRDIAAAQAEAPTAAADEADIYVGIPFCPTRCSYCSFAAEPLDKRGGLVEPYLAALGRELEAGAEALCRAGRKVRAVYLGGGTPTSLTAGQLDGLLRRLNRLFPGAVERTVEAGRPDTIDAPRLDAIAGHGFLRISVNPQTMKDETLLTIGRGHTSADIARAMELVRRYPFRFVNMDLIAGLPGEDIGDIGETLRRVAAFAPENVTVHTLAIKRASRLRIAGDARLPPEEAARAMVELSSNALRGAGYAPYYLYRQKYMAGNLENVGYAQPGTLCLYNIDNMEETVPILAFGAGAITKWLYPRELRIERAANVRNVEHYIARVDEMARRKSALLGKV